MAIFGQAGPIRWPPDHATAAADVHILLSTRPHLDLRCRSASKRDPPVSTVSLRSPLKYDGNRYHQGGPDRRRSRPLPRDEQSAVTITYCELGEVQLQRLGARNLDGTMRIVADDYVAVGGNDGLICSNEEMSKRWAETSHRRTRLTSVSGVPRPLKWARPGRS